MKALLALVAILTIFPAAGRSAGASADPKEPVAVIATAQVHQINADLLALTKSGTLARPYDRKQAVSALIEYWAPNPAVNADGTVAVVASADQHKFIAGRLAILEKTPFDDKVGLFGETFR